MNKKLMLLKLPISVAIVLSTKGGYFLGVPLFAIYYFIFYRKVVGSKEFTEHDKGLFKKTPYCIAVAALGGGLESLFIYGIAGVWYVYFLLSIDPEVSNEKQNH
ncbi:hypothetical protein C3B51_19000 [Pseudoalteromonas rubra]|uniref:Uncharacterized protein n=1 Tax=Pseudoalteromonas rubra TaxID=43658 RepID=A0A4Q7E0X4_9GAMM|nr:hypothetical protein [Pseudoalteromonas rubra]RZM75109.1 hypothetical protein C3B51_19000 [Pseudoalteromonas rubra]